MPYHIVSNSLPFFSYSWLQTCVPEISKFAMENNLQPDFLDLEIANCLAKACEIIANDRQKGDIKKSSPPSNKKLLVALSGGSDSTALLLALKESAPLFGLAIQACHIDHRLRADESDRDAQFCQDLCNQLNIGCTVIKLDYPESSNSSKQQHFSEATLREKRYQCLINFARKNKIFHLITGHTLDDQIETFLFRLFRGTSLSGLQGIKASRQLAKDIYLLRPLLNLTKSQCQAYLKRHNIEAREDSSNANEVYSRNYIRHKIIPAISSRFPYFYNHLDSLQNIIINEDNFLEDMSGELLVQLQAADINVWPIPILEKQSLAMQRRVLATAFKKRGIALSFKRLDEIVALIKQSQYPAYLNLNKNWRLKRTEKHLVWQEIQSDKPAMNLDPLEITIPSVNLLPALNMILSVETYSPGKSGPKFFNKNQKDSQNETIMVDLSMVKLPLIIRQRLPGDRISPLGMSHSVKLKKYIHTHKRNYTGAAEVYCAALLADQEEVLWLPGLGISEKIKVKDRPSHILRWKTAQTEP